MSLNGYANIANAIQPDQTLYDPRFGNRVNEPTEGGLDGFDSAAQAFKFSTKPIDDQCDEDECEMPITAGYEGDGCDEDEDETESDELPESVLVFTKAEIPAGTSMSELMEMLSTQFAK